MEQFQKQENYNYYLNHKIEGDLFSISKTIGFEGWGNSIEIRENLPVKFNSYDEALEYLKQNNILYPYIYHIYKL